MSNLLTPGTQVAPPAPQGLMKSPKAAKGPQGPRKNDIVSRRNRPLARLWRFVRRIFPWAMIVAMVAWMFSDPAVLSMVLVILGFVGRIVFAMFYMIIQFGAIFWFMSRSKVEVIKPEDPKVMTFDDYWGQPTLLRLVKQWISLLSDRDKFVQMGGRFINGILLYGPPGTGKTMLAKAMAGEAGIPFMSIEGSGFRAMFWGVDVLKMIWFCGRAKKLAREYGACIAYIDEIDAVGMSRGGVMGGQGGMAMGMGGMMGMGGGSGSLTRLLYEMDGIDEKSRTDKLKARLYQLLRKPVPPRNWHVLFMGSTNRPDVLGPALLRPGRFDQKIEVNIPDKAGRREIIKGYLSKVKYDETVNVEAIVEDTPHSTPAQIAAAITKDSVRIALFNGRNAIAQRDIDQALQEQHLGIEQPIEEMDHEQRTQVAYHEAGHAIVQHYLMPEQRMVRASIVRRGAGLGYVMHVDRTETYTAPLRRFAAEIMVAMAGHVATKLHLNEYWTGATSDFSKVRFKIWQLYSFGYFGPPIRGIENSSGGSGIPASADPLIERFWKTLEEQTEAVLIKHADEVEAIAQALLERGELSNADLMEYLGDNGYRANQPKVIRGPAGQRALRRAPAGIAAPVAVAASAAVTGDTSPHPAVKVGTNGDDMLAELKEVPAPTVEGTQPNPAVPRPSAAKRDGLPAALRATAAPKPPESGNGNSADGEGHQDNGSG
jgi:cell division protease FtsH